MISACLSMPLASRIPTGGDPENVMHPKQEKIAAHCEGSAPRVLPRNRWCLTDVASQIVDLDGVMWQMRGEIMRLRHRFLTTCMHTPHNTKADECTIFSTDASQRSRP